MKTIVFFKTINGSQDYTTSVLNSTKQEINPAHDHVKTQTLVMIMLYQICTRTFAMLLRALLDIYRDLHKDNMNLGATLTVQSSQTDSFTIMIMDSGTSRPLTNSPPLETLCHFFQEAELFHCTCLISFFFNISFSFCLRN